MYSRRTFLARSTKVIGGASLLSVPLLAACGDDKGSSSTSTTAAGTTTTAGAATTTTAAAATTTAAAGPATKVTTAFSWVPDIEWAAWYLADSKGYFAAHNIEAGLSHGGPNTPAVVQILAAGDGNIGLSGDELEILKANKTGADYIAIAAMYQRSPFGYCWLKETNIKTAADLVGKKIGGIEGDQIRIEAIFKINKLPVDYTFIPMSFDPQPLVDKEMDVITAYVTNQPVQLKLKGIETGSAPFSDFGLKSYGDVIFASKKYVDANRDVVVRYLASLLQGVDANRANPAEVIPLLVSKYGKDAEIDEAYSTAGNPAYIALMDSDYTKANGLLAMDPAYLKDQVWPGLVASGETGLPDPTTFLDSSLIADAHKLVG
jgi:ABC-type nitrate/sulfonate/bicarbonate transport system substrate-binding protein